MITRRIIQFILIFIFAFAPAVSFAQESSGRTNFAIAMYSAMGGAVLGLSTLSFYDKPNEHTDNVTIGAGLGLLLGLSYISYRSFAPADEKPKSYDFGLMQTNPDQYNFVFVKNF